MERLSMSNVAPEWLLQRTFAVEYSPNCNRKWLVRLCGYRRGRIDHMPACNSGDAIGAGDTFCDAADNALAALEKMKANNVF
jgi:hypothetical protein